MGGTVPRPLEDQRALLRLMSLGPAALVQSIPRALRRDPRDVVVMIGVTDLHSDLASLSVIDVSAVLGERDAEELADAVQRAVRAAVTRDRVTHLAVIAYADDAQNPDSTAARTAATAVVAAEAAGLRVLDAIAVTDGRWRSYDCTDPSCCPPDGTPIPEGPTP
jgi:hypothetical protein